MGGGSFGTDLWLFVVCVDNSSCLDYKHFHKIMVNAGRRKKFGGGRNRKHKGMSKKERRLARAEREAANAKKASATNKKGEPSQKKIITVAVVAPHVHTHSFTVSTFQMITFL